MEIYTDFWRPAFTWTTQADEHAPVKTQLSSLSVALAAGSNVDLKPPPTALLFTETPMATAQSTPHTSLCSAPLSDPHAHIELWSKIKTNTLFSAEWSPLNIGVRWKGVETSQGNVFSTGDELDSHVGMCVEVCVDSKPCSMHSKCVCMLPLWIHACVPEFVEVWAGSCCYCGCLWNLFLKHSLAPNIKQESAMCVGVQRYKEHKECHRLTPGRQIFFSSSKAPSKRCHNSIKSACNLKYYW